MSPRAPELSVSPSSSMLRGDKSDYLRDGRNYRSLLEDQICHEDLEPSKEKQDYLRRRQKLDELLKRKSDKTRSAPPTKPTSASSTQQQQQQQPTKPLPFDRNYGSFFGPSEPVVSRGFIEKQRSRDDAAIAAARLAKQKQAERKSTYSSSKPLVKPSRPLKLVNKTKVKVEKLKEARDYSFLLEGGDPDPPSHGKKPANNVTKPAQSQPSGKQQARQQVPPTRVANSSSSKLPPSRTAASAPSSRPPILSRPTAATTSRTLASSQSRPAKTERPRKPSPERRKLPLQPAPNKNNSVPKRPPPHEKLKASSSRLPEKKSVVNSRHVVEARKSQQTVHQHNRLKGDSSSSSAGRHGRSEYAQPPKRVRRDDPFLDSEEEEEVDYRAFMPNMFRLKRTRYEDEGYESSDMEADFNTIQEEEARSARIAREEDERERLLIEEEEKRERLLTKKRRKA